MELPGARVILRDKRLEDAEQDYIWRSDPELARLDATYPLTMTYDRFLKIFQDQLRYPTPDSHHFAIETEDGRFIGNCMYYDLDSINLEAELGIVIGARNYWSKLLRFRRPTYLAGLPVHYKGAEASISAHSGVEQAGPAVFRQMRLHPGDAGAPPLPGLYLDGTAKRGMV